MALRRLQLSLGFLFLQTESLGQVRDGRVQKRAVLLQVVFIMESGEVGQVLVVFLVKIGTIVKLHFMEFSACWIWADVWYSLKSALGRAEHTPINNRNRNIMFII